MFFRKSGQKSVLFGTRHINHIAPDSPLPVITARSPCHHIGIHIHRVHRITYRNLIFRTEYFLNVGGIAFRAVRDKNFIGPDLTSPALVIIFRYGISQKLISQIRRISPECLRPSHFLHSFVQCGNDGRSQRQCHIPDAQADYFFIRMRPTVRAYFFPDSGKKIASGKF